MYFEDFEVSALELAEDGGEHVVRLFFSLNWWILYRPRGWL